MVNDQRQAEDSLVEVRVEIPRGSRNKYEYDPDRQMFRLDRRLFSATVYPADYGFILDTLAGDGDPLDALVLVDEPTFPGCLIIARPVAVYRLRDEAGEDAKLVCVPIGEPAWDHAQDLDDLPQALLDEIAHFFAVYKLLEPGKGTTASGWEDRAAALQELQDARGRAAANQPAASQGRQTGAARPPLDRDSRS
jgi:inorganic pyrophosphatase